MIENHTRWLVSLLFPLLCLSGCPVALVGGAAAGAALYASGALTTTKNVTMGESYRAAKHALDELGVPIVTDEKDGLTAIVVGRGTENKKIAIYLKKIFDDVTEIEIKVGWIGDELQSRHVFATMEKYMDAPDLPSASVVKPGLP